VKFNRLTDWHEMSEDRAYTVACVRVDGRFRFEAWNVTRRPAVSLGVFDTAQEARGCCERQCEHVSHAHK